MQNRQKKLLLLAETHEDYPVHSRVHPLKLCEQCYIKREDELGFFLSGSKVRKYRSLIPALKKRGAKTVALIGSQNSNHILGLSMLLIENGMVPELILLDSKAEELAGNALFTQLLVPKEHIHLVPREQWPMVQKLYPHALPEGGSVKESVSGLTTLALDILQNEQELGITFKELFIDSGTGLTAAALIAAFGFLQKEAKIHVLQTALSESAFLTLLDEVKTALEELTGEQIPQLPECIQHTPTTARSFGSTNSQIFNTIATTAQQEGFFLDPIYSSKLYLLLKATPREGPTLFIHSGGLFSLAGFQKQFAQFAK